MKSQEIRQTILCVLAVALMLALLTAGFAHAQGGQFTQRERIALAMDNSPEIVIAALEAIMSQEQLAAFEAAVLPAPTDAQKKDALGDVKTKLLQAGFTKDDPLIAAIGARADEISVALPAESAQE
ncbi:MAG: hypothetical protein IT366_21755 [Candidatus Hydrogenedentes bacterium]|nr:hypothetical protein [Candidatus Hydrogenedentota bacterium]